MTGLYTRVRAVLLTIDSATQSGVSISVPEIDARGACRGYEAEAFGLARTPEEREQWVRDAQKTARELGLPLIIVGEEWTPHGISRATFISLNESWGKWEDAIIRCRVSMKNVFRVNPQTWRAAVFGRRRPKKRDELKRMAVRYVQLQLKMSPYTHDDIAESLCVRVWAERAPEIAAFVATGKREVTPKKRRPKAA